MGSYIATSALETMILRIARLHVPGIGAVILRQREGEEIAGNWELAGVSVGTAADPDAAWAAVRRVIAKNLEHWAMIPDDDWRDGQLVGRAEPQ